MVQIYTNWIHYDLFLILGSQVLKRCGTPTFGTCFCTAENLNPFVGWNKELGSCPSVAVGKPSFQHLFPNKGHNQREEET